GVTEDTCHAIPGVTRARAPGSQWVGGTARHVATTRVRCDITSDRGLRVTSAQHDDPGQQHTDREELPQYRDGSSPYLLLEPDHPDADTDERLQTNDHRQGGRECLTDAEGVLVQYETEWTTRRHQVDRPIGQHRHRSVTEIAHGEFRQTGRHTVEHTGRR